MRYKFYQDPDTGNCYAVRQSECMHQDEVSVIAPTNDQVNARVAGIFLPSEFIINCLDECELEDVKRDHPRLLAYLDSDTHI